MNRKRRLAPEKCCALFAAAAAASALLPAHAANTTWTGASGNWNTPANWSSGGTLPASSDIAYITNNDATSRSVTLNVTASFSELRIGNTGSGTNTFTQTSAFNLNLTNEFLGYGNNSHAVHSQSAGNNTYASTLALGINTGSTGIYNLSGAGSLAAQFIFVGQIGNGTFNQTGGQVTSSNYVDLGETVGSSGVYNLSNGTLSTSAGSFLGSAGNGAFLQSGGTAIFADGTKLAANSGSGFYNLSGTGIATFTGSFGVGAVGPGLLNIQAGTMAVTTTLKIYNTTNTAVNLTGGLLSVGTLDTSSNPSRFTSGWTGGTLAIAGQMGGTDSFGIPIGLTIDAAGPLGNSVSLAPGKNLALTKGEILGNSAGATFTQSGGTHSVNLELALGNIIGSSGFYNLSGTGILAVNGDENIGINGRGSFNQTGGSHSVTSNFYLGLFNGNGYYNLNGAAALLTVNGSAYIGGNANAAGAGAGILNVQAGTFTTANTLKIWNINSTAVNLSGGLLSVGTLDTSGNPSRFTTGWTGGTLAITGYMGGIDLYNGLVGLIIDSTGPLGNNISLSAGKNLSLTHGAFLGNTSGATFTQTGGTHTVNGDLSLGNNSGSSGFYTLSGTGLLSVGEAIIGALGFGSFNQTGGTHTVGILTLSTFYGSTGFYNLSGSGILTVNLGEFIGDATFGSFGQTGGTHTITSKLILGYAANSSGFFSLSGSGILTVIGHEDIGYMGLGSFNQTGGIHTVTSDLFIGFNPGATGFHSLSGSGILTVNGSAYIGGSDSSGGGTGILNIQAGTMNVASTLKIWNTGSTAVNLSGGLLSVGTLDTSGNPSRFTTGWTAGTLAITGQMGGTDVYGELVGLVIDSTGPLGNNVSLLAGKNLSLTRGEILGNTAGGTFTQSGGTHTVHYEFEIGNNLGSSGFYQLSGTGLLSASVEDIGVHGLGSFNQTGGNHSNFGVSLASFLGSSGFYNLSMGALSVINDEVIGFAGLGSFSQTGGTNSVSRWLELGVLSGSSGFYNLNGAAALATVYDNAYIGGNQANGGGTGILNIQAGTMNVANTLKIWNTGSSAVNLSGGVLSIGTLDTSSNPSRFNWTGGTFVVTGSGGIAIGPANALGSFVSIVPGKVLLVTNTLQINSGGTLAQNGSAITVGTLNNAGNFGAINASVAANTLVNSAKIFFADSTFTGSLASTNSGTLDSIGSTLTFGTGLNKLTNSGRINLIDSKVNGDITSNLGATLNTAGNVTFTGNINLSGPALLANVTSTGTFTQSGAQTWSSSATFTNTGTATFNSDPGSSSSYNLNLHISAGTLTANSPEHLASLTIDPTGTSFTGSVDLKSNYLILGPGNSSNTLRTYLLAGKVNGTGLKSTTLAAAQGIGYMDANIYNIFNPNHLFQSNTLAGNELLTKLTWQGDADLSGYITMNDYAQLQAGFFFGHFDGLTTFASWYNGDFNYDGKLNFQDFALIDTAFQLQSGTLASDLISQHSLQFGTSYTQFLSSLSTPIPEPTSLTLLILAAAPLLTRRQKSLA